MIFVSKALTGNNVPTYEEMLRSQIRNQIQAEIGENQDAIDNALAKRVQVKDAIADLQAQMEQIRVRLSEENVALHNLNAYLAKVDGIEDEVTRRYEAMQAIMRGDFASVKKTSTRTKSAGSGSGTKTQKVVAGYHPVYAIDGKPAKFSTLTHLTYRLNKTLENPIGVNDLRTAWKDQTGYDLFGSEHCGQTATITIENFEITIGLISD